MHLFGSQPYNSPPSSTFNESNNHNNSSSFSSTNSSFRKSPKFAPGLHPPPLRSINDQMILLRQEKAAAGVATLQNHSPPKEVEEKDFWVTVFGFDERKGVDPIIALFGYLGQIIKVSRPSPTGKIGNWVHLRYATTAQAQQALRRNGECIGNYYIGVIQSSTISYGTLNSDQCIEEDRSMFDETLPDENYHNLSDSHLEPKPFQSPNIRSCAVRMPPPPPPQSKSFMERFFG